MIDSFRVGNGHQPEQNQHDASRDHRSQKQQ
jgi:hypothetical protein